jgi:hypothetical protein
MVPRKICLGVIYLVKGHQNLVNWTIFQIWRRLIQYEYTMGHVIDNMIHILLGGTFHSYNKEIRHDYIHGLYFACNTYIHLSLRKNGQFKDHIKQWLDMEKPFENRISLFDTIGRSILSCIRPKKTERTLLFSTFSMRLF